MSKKDTSNKSKSKKNILQKHPLVFLLIGALIITFLWGVLKTNRIESKLTKEHQKELNELRISTGEELARVFSWSLRSELTRNNKEQAHQYMLLLLRGNLDIKNVQYIDLKSKTVTFSSNKKEEGKEVNDENILAVKEVTHLEKGNIITLMTPIMGFDRQLGVAVIEWNHEKTTPKDED